MKTLLMGKELWGIMKDGYLEPLDWSLLGYDDKKTGKEA